MNSPINEIAIAVLKKPLQDCSLDELTRLTDQFPYFAPAELLLAKKMQQENSSSYEEQVQKTSLYFQNRLWLDHLLNNTNGSATVIENRHVIEEKKELEEEPQSAVIENKESGILSEPVIEEIPEQTEALPVSPVPAEPIIELAQNDMNEMQAAGETKEPVTDQPVTPVEMPALKIEPVTGGQDFVFEPYHTVDYFASQGIKFKEEERPKDRFDQQLKSFTEWLKAMKRIPVAQVSAPGDTIQEKKVEQMAEHSIAERHIITEAMAEVWIKQGNKTKAEDIYRKLSLLDPPKSAYFAAKIEDLKKTS